MPFIAASLYAGDGTRNPVFIDLDKVAWIQLFSDGRAIIYSLHILDGSEVSIYGDGAIQVALTGSSQVQSYAYLQFAERAPKITRPKAAQK